MAIYFFIILSNCKFNFWRLNSVY